MAKQPTKVLVQELIIREPGISQIEIARRLKLSKQRVNNVIAEMRKDCTCQVSMFEDPRRTQYARDVVYHEQQLPNFIEKMLDVVQQIHDSNQKAWENVEELSKAEEIDKFLGNGIKFRKKDLLVRFLAEIRQQNEATMKMMQMMFDGKAVQEFQEEVLAAIAEVDRDVAEQIRRRLVEKRAVRTAIKLH
jgi:uncharacterized protein YjgD (DUF1641 family)